MIGFNQTRSIQQKQMQRRYNNEAQKTRSPTEQNSKGEQDLKSSKTKLELEDQPLVSKSKEQILKSQSVALLMNRVSSPERQEDKGTALRFGGVNSKKSATFTNTMSTAAGTFMTTASN